MQPGRHTGAERRLAHYAVEHPDGGDANLHRGQEMIRIFQQRQRGICTFVTRFGHGIEARFAAGGQCQL